MCIHISSNRYLCHLNIEMCSAVFVLVRYTVRYFGSHRDCLHKINSNASITKKRNDFLGHLAPALKQSLVIADMRKIC